MTDEPADDAPHPALESDSDHSDTDANLDAVSSESDDAAVASNAKATSSARSTLEWFAVIVGALVVALVVKTFLVQAFYIPSGSMIPTLEIGDRVLVNKLSYEWSDIDRGDVIVFDRPGGAGSDGISELIKRVIALPGETVEGRDGEVYVNGEALPETYLPEGTVNRDFPAEVIPDDSVWVMGDNRTNSDDSRNFKSIPIDSVVGQAEVIIWPPGEIARL